MMILTKMLKLCKKKKYIKIISYGDYRFLSDGTTAAYIDDDAENWTAEDCAISIGVSEDDRTDYVVPPATLNAISVSDMQTAAPMNYSIENYQPFTLTDKRIFFVKSEKLSIFDEVRNKRYYFGLIDGGFEPKLIIADETFPIGIIKPEFVNLNSLKTYASELSEGIRKSDETHFFDAGGQMEIEEPSEAESEDVDDGRIEG